MDRFGGSYPGGPRRREPGEVDEPSPELEDVASYEERLAGARLAYQHERRAKRLRVGFAVAIVAAAVLGAAVGKLSHRTSADVAGELQRSQQEEEFNPTEQVNRVLLELWRMEELERAPR